MNTLYKVLIVYLASMFYSIVDTNGNVRNKN